MNDMQTFKNEWHTWHTSGLRQSKIFLLGTPSIKKQAPLMYQNNMLLVYNGIRTQICTTNCIV